MDALIGDRVKQLRTERHLTQDELSTQLNKRFGLSINKSMISKWENGKGDPYLSYAKCLAFHFGVSLDYLVGLTDQRGFVFYFDNWDDFAGDFLDTSHTERINRLLHYFSKLSDTNVDLVENLAKSLAKSEE